MTVFSDSGFSVAVVGATGQVGTVMRDILVERAFPIRELRLFATARSAGSTIEVDGREIVVEDVATADPAGIQVGYPTYRTDVPGSKGRLVVGATGYAQTIVNGEVVTAQGANTGARPGRVLREFARG